ncbi:MAG: cysteine desulfurase NifS [Desulfobacterales bacterium]|nr:cysteine desulfurase NifS [Desulfobacterales bacterium]
MRRIYLDHNATTPLHPQVLQEMMPYLQDGFGNPSNTHWFGREARKAMDRARQQVADLIGAEPEEIVFVSGGTEADNLAIQGLAARAGEGARQMITTSIEHPAVLETCRFLEQKGFRITYLPVDEFGVVDPEEVAGAVTPETSLITVMLANNDVGTIEPIAEIAKVAREKGIPLHTDAVQAVGKIPVDVRELGVDLLSLSGHKIYGPKGVGALYIRKGGELSPLLHGGHQEKSRRPGTQNVPAIVGLGKACEIARQEPKETNARTAYRRNRLQAEILKRIPNVKVNGHPKDRLPNTLNMSFSFVDGESIMMGLDTKGIAVSTGSACSSGSTEPSHVLTAMGRSARDALGSVRFSLGRESTMEDVDTTVGALFEVVSRLRANLHDSEKQLYKTRSGC